MLASLAVFLVHRQRASAANGVPVDPYSSTPPAKGVGSGSFLVNASQGYHSDAASQPAPEPAPDAGFASQDSGGFDYGTGAPAAFAVAQDPNSGLPLLTPEQASDASTYGRYIGGYQLNPDGTYATDQNGYVIPMNDIISRQPPTLIDTGLDPAIATAIGAQSTRASQVVSSNTPSPATPAAPPPPTASSPPAAIQQGIALQFARGRVVD